MRIWSHDRNGQPPGWDWQSALWPMSSRQLVQWYWCCPPHPLPGHRMDWDEVGSQRTAAVAWNGSLAIRPVFGPSPAWRHRSGWVPVCASNRRVSPSPSVRRPQGSGPAPPNLPSALPLQGNKKSNKVRIIICESQLYYFLYLPIKCMAAGKCMARSWE